VVCGDHHCLLHSLPYEEALLWCDRCKRQISNPPLTRYWLEVGQNECDFKIQLCNVCYNHMKQAKRRGAASHSLDASMHGSDLDENRYYEEELRKFLAPDRELNLDNMKQEDVKPTRTGVGGAGAGAAAGSTNKNKSAADDDDFLIGAGDAPAHGDQKWVQCGGCERWLHSVCALHNPEEPFILTPESKKSIRASGGLKGKESKKEYVVCEDCRKFLAAKKLQPLPENRSASGLKKTALSNWLEQV
jgi:hypothetical protein